MLKPIPLFKSHYSIGRSILTWDKPSEVIENGPDSIIQIAKELNLNEVYSVEDNFSGFLTIYKNCKEENLNLRFGIRLSIVPDLNKKEESALKQESKIVIFMLNGNGYKDLIKIWSKAATDGFYYIPRIDWNTLKNLWTENLLLCIPFYDSFLMKNSFFWDYKCVPEFFNKPVFFLENHNLPYDEILRELVIDFCKISQFETLETFSIYYKNKIDVKALNVLKCISNRSVFSRPNLEYWCSDEFCIESYKEKNA